MASLLLGDLNDFIQPSQACVKPKEEVKTGEEAVVKINLTDCLACSGCITSAETILVSQQTHGQLLEAIERRQRGEVDRVAVCISPQSVTAMAAWLKMDDLSAAYRRLAGFLRQLGADLVFDTNLARCLSLEETWREFKSSPSGVKLAGICPGWVCYVEKRYPDLIPLMSRVRSPQQMAAILLKQLRHGGSGKIFLMSVMPCYDKKLEASRPVFANQEGSREVDSVITTGELITLIQEHPDQWASGYEDDASDLLGLYQGGQLLSHRGSGSGGYVEYLLDRLKAEDPDCLVQESCKNADHREYMVTSPTRGTIQLAAIYGFKNIQTFVQRVRSSRGPPYAFVEVMACPGGCLNGGGQPKGPGEGRQAQRDHLANLNRLYQSLHPLSEFAPLLDPLYRWIEADSTRAELLRTDFQALAQSSSTQKIFNVQW